MPLWFWLVLGLLFVEAFFSGTIRFMVCFMFAMLASAVVMVCAVSAFIVGIMSKEL